MGNRGEAELPPGVLPLTRSFFLRGSWTLLNVSDKGNSRHLQRGRSLALGAEGRAEKRVGRERLHPQWEKVEVAPTWGSPWKCQRRAPSAAEHTNDSNDKNHNWSNACHLPWSTHGALGEAFRSFVSLNVLDNPGRTALLLSHFVAECEQGPHSQGNLHTLAAVQGLLRVCRPHPVAAGCPH